MIVADLHVHTQNSDGILTIDELPACAAEAGLTAVAVTDHDRPHPKLSAPVETHGGVTIIHGIELRVATEHQRVDLLGYGLSPTSELQNEVDRLTADRIDRGRRMIESIESKLGVTLDIEPFDGIGRPHIARAVVDHPELNYTMETAFDELIGENCPCYVPRSVPSFERGQKLLADACSIVGLAHPLRYDDPAAALELTADLDAVEFHYPYDRSVDTSLLEHATAGTDLLLTGGSDAHDRTLGRAGLNQAAYDRVQSAL